MEKQEQKFLLEVIIEVRRLLSELFTSGFLSVHDCTLQELEKMSVTCMQCGLSYAGEGLKELTAEVKGNRHRMSQSFNRISELFCSLNQYISLCERKLELDRVNQ